MKDRKVWKKVIILYVILWGILYATLRVIIQAPNTIDLFVRLSLGCFLVAMMYFYILTKEKEEY